MEKPCAICAIHEICLQAIKNCPCPVDGATEEDTVKYIYEEE